MCLRAALASILFLSLFARPDRGAAGAQPKGIDAGYVLRFWRTEDGLPQNSVTTIIQSQDGYLWFGTHNGLVRFDGLRCEVFNSLNTPQLGSAAITALCADSTGTIWIGTTEGRLAGMAGNGRQFAAHALAAGRGAIHCLARTADGRLWVGTDGGLELHDPRGGGGGEATTNLLPGLRVRAVVEDSEGTVWIGSSEGLWRYRSGDLTSSTPRGTEVNSLAADPAGGIWIGGQSFGLLQLDAGSGTPRRVWPVSDVSALRRARNGDLWIAKRRGGLERLSLRTRGTAAFETGASAVNCLFEDREGNLWAGTEDAGLAQLRRKRLGVHSPGGAEAREGVTSVTELMNGQVWASTPGGQIRLFADDRFAPIPDGTNDIARFVETVCASRSGGMWIGSRFDGLFFWSGRQGSQWEHRGGVTGITALFEDRQGRLWVGSERDGVQVREKEEFRPVLAADGSRIEAATCFAQDREGGIWIGTRRSGLLEWTGGSIRVHSGGVHLANAAIQSLHPEANGALWIGTSRGLILREGARFHSVTSSDGLYDNMIYQMLEDSQGHFWFSSNRGVFRVAKEELREFFNGKLSSIHCAVYGASEGVSSTEGVGGVQPAAWRGADGRLYFATRKGLAVVDPAVAGENAATGPPVLIEEIRLDGKSAASVRAEDVRIIKPGFERLQFRYTALSFIAPEQTQFRYQLEGFDPDWLQAGPGRAASYGKLPPGEYRFRVIARSDDGIWNRSGAAAAIRILPEYWQTNWFKAALLCAVLVAAGLAWAAHAAREREIDALRQQITRDLHDDLGSNVGSIALLSEALQRPLRGGSTAAGEVAADINRIARQTLEAMRDAVWFVDPAKDSGADLLAHLRRIAGSMLRGIQHEFHASEEAGPSKLPLDLKRGIVLIFKEALHNVVRHSGASEVRIFAELNRRLFSLRIEDNGKGFDLASVERGHGLKSLRHRSAKAGGELAIQAEPGKGTVVQFSVKLS